MLLDKKRIHFVGIGGIGMSGIAIVLLEMGYKVSGSDLKSNDLVTKVRRMGGRVSIGHESTNLPHDTDLVVYSSAVPKDNAELIEAARRKIPVVHRAEILGELLNRSKGIAITGTHGKTTTTSLISLMLENCHLDPTVIIGGEVDKFRGNAKLGEGQHLVIEADESDSSFLNYRPLYSVIMNIEMEHLDHFKTLEDVQYAYSAFIKNLKKGGTLFYNNDDGNIKEILKGFKGKRKSFGLSKGADIYPKKIKMGGFETSFACVYKKEVLGKVELRIPGIHNVLNALATVLVGLNMNLEFKEIVNSIKDFTGAKRRFHLRANLKNVMLIDDYAHHPTEIRTVLDACRNWARKRLIVIFQPHRYTRTKFLADDFGRCFKGVDKLILTDIYAASEKPMDGVSIKNIYDRAMHEGIRDVKIIKKEDIADYVMKVKRAGDMILVLGAGDIEEVADELSERLNEDVYKIVKSFRSKFKSLVKGTRIFKEVLAPHTSFKIGGPADIWVEPADIKDLKRILIFAKTRRIPLFIIGGGTNLLVSDDGFRGIVIHLGSGPFKNVHIKGTRVAVGAGFNISRLVKLCCDKGLGGIESLIGIPGTVGGAVYMNAGGAASPIYKNIGEFVSTLKVIDYNGNIKRLQKEGIEFGYRRSNLAPYIILEAVLDLKKDDSGTLNSRCVKFLKIKREKQVLDMPSAGCVFKNAKGFQFTTGQMIDILGLKGMSVGGAEVSAKHANFIVNRRCASSDDVMRLINTVKKRISENFNIPLELEIKVI